MTSAISTSSPLSSGILNKRFTSWDEARFISTWKVSILPVKWLKATTAGIATKIPKAVETRASAMPPETTDIPPDPVAAMPRKAFMIPTTVPQRPTNAGGSGADRGQEPEAPLQLNQRFGDGVPNCARDELERRSRIASALAHAVVLDHPCRDHLRHVGILVQLSGFDQILDISSVKE